MKPLILVAAVVAFEFAFLASIATPPADVVSSLEPQGAAEQTLARGTPSSPVPCTPRG